MIRYLAIALFMWQCFVGVPHDLIDARAFNFQHYPWWYHGTPEMHAIFAEVTQPDKTLGVLTRPADGKFLVLWNAQYSNRLVRLKPRDWKERLGEIDYLIVHPERAPQAAQWCRSHPEAVERMGGQHPWGTVWEILPEAR